jgi:hypothetical protein
MQHSSEKSAVYYFCHLEMWIILVEFSKCLPSFLLFCVKQVKTKMVLLLSSQRLMSGAFKWCDITFNASVASLFLYR